MATRKGRGRVSLTTAMLNVIEEILNEAEAGGYEVYTQGRSEKNDGAEAEAFVENANKALKWVAQELTDRESERSLAKKKKDDKK